MRRNLPFAFFYVIKGSNQFPLLLVAILICSITACSNNELEDEIILDSYNLETSSQALFQKTTMHEMQFTAVALIEYCHGENIRFTGTIQNKVTSNTDATGTVHYTRSFRTKGMRGTGLTYGTEYDVLGGAEMFAVKDAVLLPDGTLNLPGSLAESDIVIHQGTLVFRSREDGSKVVARHVIRKVPGKDTIVNEWRCGGNS